MDQESAITELRTTSDTGTVENIILCLDNLRHVINDISFKQRITSIKAKMIGAYPDQNQGIKPVYRIMIDELLNDLDEKEMNSKENYQNPDQTKASHPQNPESPRDQQLEAILSWVRDIDPVSVDQDDCIEITRKFMKIMHIIGFPKPIDTQHGSELTQIQHDILTSIESKYREIQKHLDDPPTHPGFEKYLSIATEITGERKGARKNQEKREQKTTPSTPSRREKKKKSLLGEAILTIGDVQDEELEFHRRSDKRDNVGLYRNIEGSIVDTDISGSNVAMPGSKMVINKTIQNTKVIYAEPGEIIHLAKDWLKKDSILPSRLDEGARYICKEIRLPMADRIQERDEFNSYLKSVGLMDSSPGIPPYSQIRNIQGSYYITREFVQGRSLEYYLDHPEKWNMSGKNIPKQTLHVQPFSFHSFVEILIEVCNILLHKRGLNHGSLHPRNIIYTYGRETKVTDFGIQMVKEYLTQRNPVIQPLHTTDDVTSDERNPANIEQDDLKIQRDIITIGRVIQSFLNIVNTRKVKPDSSEKIIAERLTLIVKKISTDRSRTILDLRTDLSQIPLQKVNGEDEDTPLLGSWSKREIGKINKL